MPDSKRMEGLQGTIRLRDNKESMQLQTSERARIDLVVTNSGTARWLPSGGKQGSVNIGILITDSSGTKQCRSHISDNGVSPGQTLNLVSELPRLPIGDYSAEIDLVAEYVCWFRSIGNKSLKLTLTVS